MKKLCLLLGLAVAAGFNSCSRDLSENPDPVPQGKGMHSLKAAIEPDKPETRTGLGEKDEDKGSTPLLWSSSDQIAVVDDSHPSTAYKYILDESAAGKPDGTFTVESGEGVKDASSITAYYPYEFYTASQGLSIPAAQKYKAGRTMETNMLPMYAHSSGTQVGELLFQPVAGIINLQLKKNAKLSESRIFYSVKLVSSADNLAGKGTLTDDGDGAKLLAVDGDNAKKEIDFSLGDNGIELSAAEVTSLMFVVPARTYAAATLKFILTYKDAPGDAVTQTVELPVRSAIDVPRGHIVNFATTDVGIVEKAQPSEVRSKISDAASSGAAGIPDVIEVSGMDGGGTQTIELPKVYGTTDNQEQITLVATDAAAGTTIQVQECDGHGAAAHRYVSVANQTDNLCNLAVNLPNSTVTVDGSFTNVEATTADQTLVIPSGTTIQNLTVKKGSVKIYGTVVNLTTESGWTGSIVRGISSQEDLVRALSDTKSDYALIDKPVFGLDGKGGSLALPLEVAANASLSNLTIQPSDAVKANGVVLKKDSIEVTLDKVDILVSSNDVNAGLNTGVLIKEVNDVMVNLKDCRIVVPKSNQRGVNMHSATTSGICTLNLDNTHIGPTLEPLTADFSQDYTSEQIEAFKGRSDSRGITFGQHAGKYVVNIKNGSVIEGVFYALNFIPACTSPVEINVDRSVIDGRCAFNIWANGAGVKIDVANGSKLVGRNYFGGPTEVFANIVLESKANGGAAQNNVITVRDSEFHCFNNPQTPTNWQYVADVRSEGVNTLQLLGRTEIYDHSGRLDNAVKVRYWSNKVTVDPTVAFAQGKEGASVLPSNVWDGYSVAFPGASLDGKVYIGTPDQLAILTTQALPAGTDIVLVRDLDLNDKPWLAKYDTPKAVDIDGGGHTIYNLNSATKGWDTKISGGTSSEDQSAGLFATFAGTLKNLTVKNAKIYGSRSGGLIGRLDYGTISNCHVKNVTFTGGAQKMGGLVGYVNGTTQDLVIENCSVEGGTIVNDPAPKDDQGTPVTDDASCQAGGLLGFVMSKNINVTVQNCAVKNVTVESGKLWDTSDQLASHTFIGNIANNKYPNAVFTLTGNSIQRSSCDAVPHANRSEFLGFFYPTGADSNNIPYARVVVDGAVIAEGPAAQ